MHAGPAEALFPVAAVISPLFILKYKAGCDQF